MLILTIRSEQGSPELGLYEDQTVLATDMWPAEREFALTLPKHVESLLQGADKQLNDLRGIVCFAGPGSFTGLRIGHTYVNALSYALNIPIVSSREDDWLSIGIDALLTGRDDKVALPLYGAEARITMPRIK